jgi:TPR repeat protein
LEETGVSVKLIEGSFMARRRSGGIGLGGLLVVVALLYFTGAGAWLWARVKNFDQNCYEMLASIGTDTGAPICAGVGQAIQAIDRSVVNISSSIDQMVSNFKNRFGGMTGFSDFGGFTRQLVDSLMSGSSPLNDWVSPSDKLAQMMNGGPAGIGSGASAAERIRASLDNFVIGQHFLSQGGGNATNALPWLRQGAQQPGYGIMSQLALGDLYRGGSSDIPADPVRARNYYQQAQQSLSMLNTSAAPESAQLLKSLPVAPAEIQQQLTGAIAQLTKQIRQH